MIFGQTDNTPADFPDIKVGREVIRRRQIAQLLDYKDANGRLITPDGYVASMNDTYKFSFDVGTGEKDFTLVEFRSGDRRLASNDGSVEKAARDVVGGATAIPESITQSTSQLEYLNYVLSLAGKKNLPKETAKAGGLTT